MNSDGYQAVKFPARVLRRLRREATGRWSDLREFLWWRSAGGRDNRVHLEALRNRYVGRRCFIMGNGPSLKRTDVRLLREEVTIGSNAIFLIFDEMGYQPTFVTVEDQLVAEDRAERLNALRGSTKVFPRDLSYWLRPDPDTVYVNFVRQYEGFPKFSATFERVAYWGGTVSMFNLQLAYHLGCDPIYLIGFDHNYTVPKDLKSDVILSQSDDVNHIHPDYFGKGYRWHDPQVDRMEAGYRVARAFLEQRGRHVYNATAGGRLEVFQRVDYSEVVGGG
jgi:hypothetical protein